MNYKRGIRKGLETNWFKAADAKYEREIEEKIGIPEKITVQEQLDHYRYAYKNCPDVGICGTTSQSVAFILESASVIDLNVAPASKYAALLHQTADKSMRGMFWNTKTLDSSATRLNRSSANHRYSVAPKKRVPHLNDT